MPGATKNAVPFSTPLECGPSATIAVHDLMRSTMSFARSPIERMLIGRSGPRFTVGRLGLRGRTNISLVVSQGEQGCPEVSADVELVVQLLPVGVQRVCGVGSGAEGVVAVVAAAFAVGGDLDDGALQPAEVAVGVGGVPGANCFGDPWFAGGDGVVGEVLAAPVDGVGEFAGSVAACPQAGFGGVPGELVVEVTAPPAEFGEVPVDVGDLLGLGQVGPFGAQLALLFVEGVEFAAEPDHVGAGVGVGEFVVELGEGAGFGGVDGDGDELVVEALAASVSGTGQWSRGPCAWARGRVRRVRRRGASARGSSHVGCLGWRALGGWRRRGRRGAAGRC